MIARGMMRSKLLLVPVKDWGLKRQMSKMMWKIFTLESMSISRGYGPTRMRCQKTVMGSPGHVRPLISLYGDCGHEKLYAEGEAAPSFDLPRFV